MVQRTIDYAVLVSCSVMYGAAVMVLKHMRQDGRSRKQPAADCPVYSRLVSEIDSATL